MSDDEYPDDYDPLFGALVRAAGWAKSERKPQMEAILDTLLDFYRDDRVDEFARAVEQLRQAPVTITEDDGEIDL